MGVHDFARPGRFVPGVTPAEVFQPDPGKPVLFEDPPAACPVAQAVVHGALPGDSPDNRCGEHRECEHKHGDDCRTDLPVPHNPSPAQNQYEYHDLRRKNDPARNAAREIQARETGKAGKEENRRTGHRDTPCGREHVRGSGVRPVIIPCSPRGPAQGLHSGAEEHRYGYQEERRQYVRRGERGERFVTFQARPGQFYVR